MGKHVEGLKKRDFMSAICWCLHCPSYDTYTITVPLFCWYKDNTDPWLYFENTVTEVVPIEQVYISS